jgi:hypothetical protein
LNFDPVAYVFNVMMCNEGIGVFAGGPPEHMDSKGHPFGDKVNDIN